MTHSNFLLLGSSDYADVVADAFEGAPDVIIEGYVENLVPENCNAKSRLKPIYWHEEIEPYRETHALISILGTTLRRGWIESLEASGFRFGRLIHPASTVSSRCEVGSGSLIDAGCVIAGFTTIDEHVRVGRMNSIGHHTTIKPYSTIHPRCIISGRVTIEEQVIVSTGAVILPDVTIGKGAVIGAGAMVKKNVPPGALVRGNPSSMIKANFGPK